MRVIKNAQEGKDGLPISLYRVYSIENSSPESLIDFVMILQ